jgi:hypothetical protein
MGYIELRDAIIEQAIKDYFKACRRPEVDRETIIEVEKFFLSEYAEILLRDTNRRFYEELKSQAEKHKKSGKVSDLRMRQRRVT